MMKSALQVMLTTRKGIIVFMAHVTMLDATAAYPNHIGHSVCLRNSILSSPASLDTRPARSPPPYCQRIANREHTINTVPPPDNGCSGCNRYHFESIAYE